MLRTFKTWICWQLRIGWIVDSSVSYSDYWPDKSLAGRGWDDWVNRMTGERRRVEQHVWDYWWP